MHWNYRVIKQTTVFKAKGKKKRITSFAIHEVYYNRKGQIVNRTETPVGVVGNSIKDLKSAYKMMNEAFDNAVIVDKDIVYSEDLPDPVSIKERLGDITIQFSPFDWGRKFYFTKVVDSFEDEYAYKMGSGFKLGPFSVIW